MKEQAKKDQIRVRLAPSPTGGLHIGTARTALYNWLFAKKYAGEFVLRIEDTDTSRSTSANEQNIIQGLKWLGLDWDEGPDMGGEFGPYRQTQRSETYGKYIQQLLEDNKAYYCYCTPEQLEADRAKQINAGLPPVYGRRCCNMSAGDAAELKKKNPAPVIRFKVPEGQKIKFVDLVRGSMEFNSKDIGDFVISRDAQRPLFLLANLIDDLQMRISHVIRGEDHLPNVPKQILLARALGVPIPAFAHLSLILNPDRSKMSKRAGPTRIDEYKELGYLPEAVINYVALLGWNPGTTEEIFTRQELISNFSLEGLNKGGAVFDLKRLKWMNGVYLRRLAPESLLKVSQGFLSSAAKKLEPDQLEKILTTLQERLSSLSEIPEHIKLYLEPNLDYDPALLVWKKGSVESTRQVLNKISDFLQESDKFMSATPDEIERSLRTFAEDNKLGVGELFWPLRVALSGLKASPGPQEIIWVLGVENSLKRLNYSLKSLSGLK